MESDPALIDCSALGVSKLQTGERLSQHDTEAHTANQMHPRPHNGQVRSYAPTVHLQAVCPFPNGPFEVVWQ
jgi:hypothetical protein